MVLLIVISFILPATAVKYSSGSTTDNNAAGSSGSTTDNNGTSSSGSTASNNTGNVQQQSAEFIKTILDIHNRERAAVSVPPLVWNNTLADDAKTYAEHLIATGKFEHPNPEWVAAHPMSPESDNLAVRSPQNPADLA